MYTRRNTPTPLAKKHETRSRHRRYSTTNVCKKTIAPPRPPPPPLPASKKVFTQPRSQRPVFEIATRARLDHSRRLSRSSPTLTTNHPHHPHPTLEFYLLPFTRRSTGWPEQKTVHAAYRIRQSRFTHMPGEESPTTSLTSRDTAHERRIEPSNGTLSSRAHNGTGQRFKSR